MVFINTEGHKELLGMWLSQNEGAKFWLGILTELKKPWSGGHSHHLCRWTQRLPIGYTDGLSANPHQLCIVHMVRNSMKFVPWRDYKEVAADLKRVYQSATKEEALHELDQLDEKWTFKYPQISRSWRQNWDNFNTLFAYPSEIRKAIYITNAIESLNSVIRKAMKKRKLFSHDDAAKKVVYLATREASKKWTMLIRNWRSALNHLMIVFEERLSDYV